MLTELCLLTGWHRDHARKQLRAALGPKPVVKKRVPRPVVYSEEVVAALRKVWAVLDAPAGKRLAPFLPEVVARLRACGELDIDDATAARLSGMSAATIDRRLAGERKRLQLRGRTLTKPGSLLKSAIPVRTWAQWDEAQAGFVEIDTVGHEGGDPRGEHCYTLTVTDVATGWTELRGVRNRAQKWVFVALQEVREAFPFPIIGIDCDNGGDFINHNLLRYCEAEQITFTRSRPGNSNDGAHVEEKNWSVVRRTVGYWRYDTAPELLLLNEIYAKLRLQINFFAPHQKLVFKQRAGAKVVKRYDTAATAYQRVLADPSVPEAVKAGLASQYATLNPAQLRREILALSGRLLELVRDKPRAPGHPAVRSARAQSGEATNPPSRAS